MVNHSQLGVELMGQIASGDLKFKQSDIALEVKRGVSTAMDEIISVGARVRPLKLDGKRVGWLRPLAYSERKILDAQIEDDQERVLISLIHCTSLTENEITDLDIHEVNSILRRLYQANMADLTLFPYISAYATTQSSQNLWASRHDTLFNRRLITMPDGQTLKFMATPDHIGLWATLSTIRQNSIHKLEESLNFGTLIRTWAGKSADKYVKDIVRNLNLFETDLTEPWIEAVDFLKFQADIPQFNDGFGHAHQDSTVEGILREMDGMFNGDKHEQLMQTFYDKQLNEAKAKDDEVQRVIQQRRKALDEMEDDGAMVVVTDAEVRRREKELQQRRRPPALRQHEDEMLTQEDDQLTGQERIAKYFTPR